MVHVMHMAVQPLVVQQPVCPIEPSIMCHIQHQHACQHVQHMRWRKRVPVGVQEADASLLHVLAHCPYGGLDCDRACIVR